MDNKVEEKKKKFGKGFWICIILVIVIFHYFVLMDLTMLSGHIQAFLMGIAVDLGIIQFMENEQGKKKAGLGKGCWISVALIVVVVFLLLVWDMVSGPIYAVILSFLADWGFIQFMEREQKEGKSCARTAFTCLIIAAISVVGVIVFINILVIFTGGFGGGDMGGGRTLRGIAADLGII